MKTLRQNLAAIAIAACLAVFGPLAQAADPSGKWRVELNHTAQSDGAIVLRITPVGGKPIEAVAKVPAKTTENGIATSLSNSLKLALGAGYLVEKDDGEDVLIKKLGKTLNFEVALVSSSLLGVEIKLQRE